MIQDWKLERYRLGELPPSDRAEVDAALAADPTVKARLDALESDSKAVLARLPAAKVAAEVQRRARTAVEPKRERPRWVLVPAMAMAAVLALAIAYQVKPKPGLEGDIIKKGDPKLLLFKRTTRGEERLYETSTVKPHDVVQVKFDLSNFHQMVVFSIDGGGHTTLHFPLDGNTVPAPGANALAQSFELDDAPGYERFFLVTADQLSSDEVMEAARALALRPDAKTAPLTLPKGSAQRSLRLDKVTP